MAQLPEIFEAAAHQVMSNLDLALDLARQGVHVFPCQPDGPDEKKPCPGVFWRNTSTTNETRIRQWWDRWPNALPGLDLAKAGFVVVDCDRKPGQPDGVSAFQDLAASHNDELEGVPVVETANGGQHHYFRQWAQHGNGKGALPAGIDVRGHGGYVIAPGATFLDGRRYEPIEGDFQDAKDAPHWLIEILTAPKGVNGHTFTSEPAPPVSDDRKRSYGQAALQEEAQRVASCAHPRNITLNGAAFACGQLVAGGCLSEPEVRSALVSAAQACGLVKDDGLRSVQATISSGLKAGAREPRGPPEDPGEVIVLTSHRIIEAPDGTRADAETGEIIPEPEPAAIVSHAPRELLQVPGIVGLIADWISSTARFPQPVMSLAAALTLVGTAAGRHIEGPSESSTHLYIVCLAPSGYGKNHPLNQIKRVMEAAGMRHHIGPDQFMSMPAAINFMMRSPLALCPMDEFGSFLKRINNKRASGFEAALSGTLRQAWDAFKLVVTPEWAGRAAERIVAPALSVYGASNPEEFYSALEGADVTNGVLNRFLIFDANDKPEEREPKLQARAVPPEIINGLRAIYYASGEMVAAQLNRSDEAPPTIKVKETPEALAIRRAFAADVRAMSDANAKHRPFLVRTSENAIRLATIQAIGRDPVAMMVNADDMRWACELSMWCARNMITGAGLYIADSETQAVANVIRRAIVGAGGRIKRRDLIRTIDHRYRARDIDEGIKALAEGEEIQIEKVDREGGGPPSYWYTIRQ